MGELIYIDEYRRERWLLKLELARAAGVVAVFNAELGQDATVLQFPVIPEGGDAA